MEHRVKDSKVFDLWRINIFDKVIDDVIHALRIKYRIEIYNTAEPFVSPSGKDKGKYVIQNGDGTHANISVKQIGCQMCGKLNAKLLILR